MPSPGRAGVGLTQQTAFRVPARSIGYWTHRLIEKGVTDGKVGKRFGQPVLEFTDPDGMGLALVGVEGAEAEPAWSDGEIPAEHAIRGFHGATLMLASAERTGAVLTDVLGFRRGRPRGRRRALPGERSGRRHHRHPRGQGLPAGPHGSRLGAPHRLPRQG